MQNTEYKTIQTWDDACNAKRIPTELPDVSGFPEEFRTSALLHYQIMVFTGAVNGEWKPDMADTDTSKYSPYFWIEDKASGLGLSFFVTGCTNAGTGLGSRLLCETRDQAKHVAEIALPIFEEYCLRG